MNSLYFRRLLVLTILAGALGMALLIFPYGAPRAGAATTNIDQFDDTWAVTNSVAGTSVFSYTNVVGVLGGQREVTVTNSASSGSGDITFQSNSPAGTGSYNTAADVLGVITLTYDGTSDGGAAGVNPTGLGGVDLSANAIVVAISQEDWAGSMTVNYWSDASRCSTLTRSTPAGISPGSAIFPIVFRFRDFSTCSGYSTAAVSNTVGAIQLVVSSATKSTDIIFDMIASANLDFGDAPTSYRTNYNATLSSSGPYHVINGALKLGSVIDGEEGESVGGTNAVIDDNTTSDDEDGVTRFNTTPWTNGGTASLTITVSGGSGCLYGWFDWGNDGAFDDDVGSSDRIISTTVSAGTARYDFTSQADTNGNQYYARFRLYPQDQDGSCNSAKSPEGNPAFGGEVEDYRFGWMPTAVSLNSMSATAEANSVLPFALAGLGVVALGAVVLVRRRK